MISILPSCLAQEGDAPALSGRASRSVGTFFPGGLLCAGQGTCDATGDAWKGERT